MNSTIWLAFAACVLLGLSSFQFSSVSWRASRLASDARRRRLAVTGARRQQAEFARLNSELRHQPNAGSDWRVMEVAEVAQESEDCRSYYLVDPYGQPLPDFLPGQYLMVRPALAGSFQITRCYSISSVPNKEFWRITVKRQSPPTDFALGRTAGGLSEWLHRNIGQGDCLLIAGPRGSFVLDEHPRNPIILLAAGVGITPLASMLGTTLHRMPGRPVALLFQARDSNYWPLGQTLHRWQVEFPSLKVTSFFSQIEPGELDLLRTQLPGAFVEGRFTASQAVRQFPNQNGSYFLCGPEPWMKQMRKSLVSSGVAAEAIHWESFGGAEKPLDAAQTENSETEVRVRFERSNIDSIWNDARQSLWELARQHQIPIASGCLSGGCGCCRVRILSGEVEYDRPLTVELPAGECLSCVARPKTELCVDV